METKVCNGCSIEKDVSDYYRTRTGGPRSKCKACFASYAASRVHLRRTGPKTKRSPDGSAKVCSVCKDMKDLDQYHRSKNHPDGHVARCKPCTSEYQKRRAQEQPERVAEIAAANYRRNREKRAATQYLWNQANREKVLATKRRSQEKLRDTVRVRRRERYAEDPLYRAARRAQVDRRRRAHVPMSEQDKHLSSLFRVVIAEDPCYYCGTSEAEQFHIDHYVPIARGGTDHWWNLVQACAPCNLSKNDRMPDEFMDSRS